MSRRTWIEATAAVAVATVLAAACSFGSGKDAAKEKPEPPANAPVATTPTRAIRISPALQVAIRPTVNHKLDVSFDESEVETSGDQWRAAGWNAVTVATMLTGAPLNNREIAFTVNGPIDGPSAGALMTVAVIALIRGDSMQPDITMTGTINVDGGVGPVRGIPEKVDAAALASKARMLIPEGQRTTVDDAGKSVDVIARGRAKDVRVVETSDIYDAYKEFTGKAIPKLPAATNTELNDGAYKKLAAKVETWSAKYEAALNELKTLSPTVQQDLNPYASVALLEELQARSLTKNGHDAGAFSASVNAAALMHAVAQTGQSFPTLLGEGVQPFIAKIKAGEERKGEVSDVVKKLSSFTPKTVGDASALIAAYGSAIDAVSLARYAQYLFDTQPATEPEAMARVAQGAIYYALAGPLINAAADLLSVGQDLGGAALGPKVDVADIAAFYRRAAKANLEAFESGVIGPLAFAGKMSLNEGKDAFARADTSYALARTGSTVLQSLAPALGTSTASPYAQLAGAISLYVRTTGLQAKYQSLGHVDPETLQLAGMANGGRAFNVAIQNAQTQLTHNLASLRAKHVSPTIPAADIEIARVDQNGDVSAKFDALSNYWDGYVNSRLLAYLGGFPQP